MKGWVFVDNIRFMRRFYSFYNKRISIAAQLVQQLEEPEIKLTAVNELVKNESDQTTTGILLCKNKDNFEVEFALRDINKPIGVSEYRYKEFLKI